MFGIGEWVFLTENGEGRNGERKIERQWISNRE